MEMITIVPNKLLMLLKAVGNALWFIKLRQFLSHGNIKAKMKHIVNLIENIEWTLPFRNALHHELMNKYSKKIFKSWKETNGKTVFHEHFCN